jgi:hypothetical protein
MLFTDKAALSNPAFLLSQFLEADYNRKRDATQMFPKCPALGTYLLTTTSKPVRSRRVSTGKAIRQCCRRTQTEAWDWWDRLTEGEQESVRASVKLLEAYGPTLPFPHSSGVTGSRHSHMRELRIQHAGHPFRVLHAFDPRRCAILLIGGDKTGNDRWYEEYVPIADRLYDEHLEILKKEDSENGS